MIYDANNGNIEARRKCLQMFDKKGVHVIFLGRSWDSTRTNTESLMRA